MINIEMKHKLNYQYIKENLKEIKMIKKKNQKLLRMTIAILLLKILKYYVIKTMKNYNGFY
jgi:hypothetical protein